MRETEGKFAQLWETVGLKYYIGVRITSLLIVGLVEEQSCVEILLPGTSSLNFSQEALLFSSAQVK